MKMEPSSGINRNRCVVPQYIRENLYHDCALYLEIVYRFGPEFAQHRETWQSLSWHLARTELYVLSFLILKSQIILSLQNLKIDPGIEYVIEPPRSPEIPSPQSIIPQELDKHDYTLIGSKPSSDCYHNS